MAISWGSINGHLRVGIDTSSSTSNGVVTTKWTVYVQAVAWGFNDPQTITLSGAVNATKNYTMVSPNGGTATVNVGTWTSSTSQSSGSQTLSLTATVSNAYNGSTASKTQTAAVKAIAQTSIDPPVRVQAYTYDDPNVIQTAWQMPESAKVAGSLWYYYHIQKQVGTNTAWSEVAYYEDSMVWYDDKNGITSNNRYLYRVRSENDGAQSPWVNADDYVYTLPADPMNLVAKVTANGVNLSWTSNSPFATGWTIYDNNVPIADCKPVPPGVQASPRIRNAYSNGTYQAFPYMGVIGETVLIAWRDANDHAYDPNSKIRMTRSTDGGQTYQATYGWNGLNSGQTATANTGCAPAGVVWDTATAQWVMLIHWNTYASATSRSISAMWGSVATSKDGQTWTNGANVDLTGVSWFYPSDIKTNGTLWVVAGYGSLKGGVATRALVSTSTDQGKTWSPMKEVAGYPDTRGWAEPQIGVLSDNSWYMTMRTDNPSELHYARSSDGVNWTYGGLLAKGFTGQPTWTQLPNGALIVLCRNQNTHYDDDDRMGTMAWGYSLDNGATWKMSMDSFDTEHRWVYGSLGVTASGRVPVVFAIENEYDNTTNITASVHYSWFDPTPSVTGTGTPSYTLTGAAANPNIQHTYSVRAVAGTVPSNGVASIGPLTLSAAPSAPVGLTPAADYPQEVGLPTHMSWEHVSNDSSLQSAYNLRYRPKGSSTWTETGKTTSTISDYLVPGGPQALGTQWEWQVQTWGVNSNPSPWSAIAVYGVHSVPTAVFTYPDNSIPSKNQWISVDTKVMTTWTFTSPEGDKQQSFEMLLEDVTPGQPSQVIEDFTDTDDSLSYITPDLLDGHTYRATLIATDTNGMSSPPVSETFQVKFDPPDTPVITADWKAAGYVEVHARVGDINAGAPTTKLELYRGTESGGWELIATSPDASPITYYDVTAPMAGNLRYKVVAYSDIPSTADATAVLSTDQFEDGCGIWLSGGPGFTQVIYLRIVPKADRTSGRDRTLNQFAGRAYPVETSHDTKGLTISVTGKLEAANRCITDNVVTVTRDEIEALFDLPGPHYYRDSYGHTMYCSLSDVTLGSAHLGDASFTVTKVERGTDDQLLAIEPYMTPRLVEISPGEFAIVGGDLEHIPPAQWTYPNVTMGA